MFLGDGLAVTPKSQKADIHFQFPQPFTWPSYFYYIVWWPSRLRTRSYMFLVQDPSKMFSEQVLGTRAFRLRALWNVLGAPSFRFKIGTHLGLSNMTYCVYTAQCVRSFLRALSVLIAVCVLSPAHLEHVLGFTSFRLRFVGALRGRCVPRTCFDRVPAGTVLAGTGLFRTRSDYKKWCVPRTCSSWNCTENKCERPVIFLHVSLIPLLRSLISLP